jgi:hypothetical protein
MTKVWRESILKLRYRNKINYITNIWKYHLYNQIMPWSFMIARLVDKSKIITQIVTDSTKKIGTPKVIL